MAFASLAGATSPERMGQTMGAAEVGREPAMRAAWLVGVIAAAATLPLGRVGLAVLLAAIAAAVLLVLQQ